jgi:hypothetical protein
MIKRNVPPFSNSVRLDRSTRDLADLRLEPDLDEKKQGREKLGVTRQNPVKNLVATY